jgi:hypothetical protein
MTTYKRNKMIVLNKTLLIKYLFIFIIPLIVASILWKTNLFLNQLKNEERLKMEVVAAAQRELAKSAGQIELPLKILGNNNSIPMILLGSNGKIVSYKNLDAQRAKDSLYLKKQLDIMKAENMPIIIEETQQNGKMQQAVYYRNSDLLNNLQFYPLVLLLIFFIFSYSFFLLVKYNRAAEQNKLWNGMAKETAHQIGTPLSSILGWIAILKTENTNQKIVDEIEKDVYRLNVIADRFSKIGSKPKLEKIDVCKVLTDTLNYLKIRSSSKVSFELPDATTQIHSFINAQLFSWVIENLVKNAIDSMNGVGNISIKISTKNKHIVILIADSGKGIFKKNQKNIFKPGFSTKKRGWGLGLSLAKRIIENYHEGKISLLKSEIGKGATFRILLKLEG